MADSTEPRATRILEAADELLGEVGYDAMSVQAVADRAGVNKALIFYYFGSKSELFEHVLERYYEAHRKALAGAFEATTGTLDERLHNVIDAYLDFMDDNQRYARVVQQQIAGADTHHEPIRRNLRTIFDWLKVALEGVAPADGPLSAKHFYVTLSGLTINYYTYAPVLGALWEADPMGEDARAERRAHVHFVVDALLAALAQRAGSDDRQTARP